MPLTSSRKLPSRTVGGLYFVRPNDGEWRIQYSGELFGPYDTQANALTIATKAAKDAAARGFDAFVRVRYKNGKVRTVWKARKGAIGAKKK